MYREEARKIYEEGHFVMCLECGEVHRELNRHLKRHNLTSVEYLKKYTLDDAKVISKYTQEKHRASTKEQFMSMSDEEKRAWKTRVGIGSSSSWSKKTQEEKDAILAIRGEAIGKAWGKKPIEEKIVARAKQGKTFSEHFAKKSREELQVFSEIMRRVSKKYCSNLTREEKFIRNAKTGNGVRESWKLKPEEEKKVFGQMSSEKISRLIAEGRLEPHSNYVYGHYRNEYFQSSYEYRVMRLLDILEIMWTRDVIRIPWFNPKRNQTSNYPPDFIVNGNEIWEAKGYIDKDGFVLLKAEAAHKFVEESYGRYTKYRLLFNNEIIELEKEAASKLNWSFERYQRRIRRELLCYKLKISFSKAA